MTAAKGHHSGRRRLLLLVVAVVATAAAASFGLTKAYAAVQFTTTSLSITDASTGQPITGDIRSDKLVTLTVTVSGGSYVPAGTVTLGKTTDGVSFSSLCDGNGDCGWPVTQTGPLTAQASVTMYLPVGTYDLQAAFQGSNGSISSHSALLPVNVVLANAVHNTSTAVTANPSSINVGDSTTLTATVSSNDGIGIPQGTVYFYTVDGTVKSFVDSAQLDANGQASLTRSDWTVQTYTIEADYLGQVFVTSGGATVQYLGSSGTATLTVGNPTPQKVQTTTTLTATPNVIRSDQTVVFLAHIVENGSCVNCGPLDGTVSYTATSGAGSVVLGQAPVDANGYAELDVGGWVPGTYTITANYFGNVYYAPSSGEVTIFTVNPATPTATTYLHDTQAYVGSTATLAAQVLDLHGNPVPAGEPVTLTAGDPSMTSCIGTTDATGTAACTVQFQAAGTYSVTASYPGDTTYDPSTGFGQVAVAKVPSAVTYTGAGSAPTGATTTLSGRLVDALTGLPIAGAPVTLTLNANESCSATTDASGNGSCHVTVSEPSGTYQVSLSYAGTAKYLPSSTTAPFTVTAVLPTHLGYVGDATALAGRPATIAFRLTDDNGNLLSGRQVVLSLDGRDYTVTTDANGVASQQVTAPATAGPYAPTASYGGEPGYLPGTGTGALQVNTVPTTVTYVGTPSVYGGSPATIAFKLTDQGGNALSGMPVTLTLPDGSTYPATTDANGVASTTVTAPTPSQQTGYPVAASFPGRLPYVASSGTGSLTVNVVPTTVTYTGDTNVYGGTPATIAFTLRDATDGSVLPNMPVTLTLPDGSTYPTTTDANGVASTVVTAPLDTGTYPVSASFGGRAQYVASSGSGALVVTSIPTTVTYAGDTQVYQGATATLAAKLLTNGGQPLANEPVTLTLATGETCSASTDAAGVASCQVVVNEATTLAGNPYDVAISFGGDAPYLASSGHGTLAVVAQYPAPGVENCTATTAKCESLLADPTVVSNTQLSIVGMDDSPIVTSGAKAPTAVLGNGQQLYVTTSPTSGQPQNYVDGYRGSISSKHQTLITIDLPAGLSPGQYTVRITAYDGDGDLDQWTWTIGVGSGGSVTTLNAGPGPLTCGSSGVKCESLLADPTVVSNTQLSIVGMDEAPIVTAGAKAPSAVLSNGQVLDVTTSPTSGQPANFVDTNGGASSKYQTLITIDLPPGLAPGSYSILVTAYDGDGDVDQWSWPITVASDGTVTSTAGSTGAAGVSSAIAADFNGTAVPAGDTLSFSNVLKADGVPASGATISFHDQTIQLGGTTIPVPDSEVVFSPTATTSTTAYVGGKWVTTVPVRVPGKVFASGVGYLLPSTLAGGLKHVVWSGTISSSVPRVTVNWQWSAAAYSAFGTDPSTLGVKAADDPKTTGNSDHAGTPENWKRFVVGGARGGGGSNYTGSLSGTVGVKF